MSHRSDTQRRQARLRRDSNQSQGEMVSYEDQKGRQLDWVGDDEAPFVKPIGGTSTSPSGSDTQAESWNDQLDSDQLQVFSGEGNLFTAFGMNHSGQTLFLMYFDRNTALAGGEAPIQRGVRVPNNETASINFGSGRHFDNGARLAWSTTEATFTSPGSSPGAGLTGSFAT